MKMVVEEEFENNTVHVEEVTLIENTTIKMESEDQNLLSRAAALIPKRWKKRII
jgi:hypothetical protein